MAAGPFLLLGDQATVQSVTTVRAAVPVTEPPERSLTSLGTVVLVFGAQSQSGTSGAALALADTAAAAGLRVQLIDSSDPARSGLAAICHTEGGAVPGGPGGFLIRHGTRRVGQHALRVLRIVNGARPPRLDQVPRPVDWVDAAQAAQAHLTVVDAGFDVWQTMAPESGLGPLRWPGLTTVPVHPLLVMKATWPSASAAEVILHRYDVGVQKAGFAPVSRVVVTGASAWPAHVRGAMGRLLAALADTAVFLPHHADALVNGWRADPTPPEFSEPVSSLLRNLGEPFAQALPAPEPSRRGWRRPRSS